MTFTTGDKIRIIGDKYGASGLKVGAICVVTQKRLGAKMCGVKGIGADTESCIYDEDAVLVEPFDRGMPAAAQRPTVVEFCSECETEVELLWDVKKQGYKAFCPHCGARLMLCDECRHRGPGGECVDDCDYDMETDSCRFNPAKEVS